MSLAGFGQLARGEVITRPMGYQPIAPAKAPEWIRLFYGRITWAEFHAWGRDGTGEAGRKPKPIRAQRFIQLPNGQRLDVRTKG